MRVIPVLDVRGGVAVRADGGPRRGYRPVRSTLAAGCAPRALARAFRERLGLGDLYLADLDAIASAGAALGDAVSLVAALARDGSRVWVDAGTRGPGPAAALLAAGARRVVVGLETLRGLADLRRLGAALEPERLAFSLDIWEGRPVVSAPGLARLPAWRLAEAALEAGFETLVALELGRVGKRAGPAVDALREVGPAAPAARWYAGGGVRDLGDLQALAAAGWEGSLVGTALHEGVIGREELKRLQ